MSDEVLACQPWNSNAELIRDCATLGYLKQEWVTLDPTYGGGIWWKLWQPTTLVAHRRFLPDPPDAPMIPVVTDPSWDFRCTGYEAGTFDAIAFDPPYVSKGGRATSGIKQMDKRFGQDDAPATPELLQNLINLGLIEMHRVLKKARSKSGEPQPGMLLVKCQDYISSGKLWPGTLYTTNFARDLGFQLIDRLEHYGTSPRPQPGGRRQVHARRNLSTLLVFKKQRD